MDYIYIYITIEETEKYIAVIYYSWRDPFCNIHHHTRELERCFQKYLIMVFLQCPGHTRDLESQLAGAVLLMNNASLRPAPSPTGLYWLKGFLEPAEDDDVCVSMKILF